MGKEKIGSITVPRIDPIYIKAIYDSLIDLREMNRRISEMVEKKWDKKVYRKLKGIALDGVEAFYDDYEPNKYRRLEDLLNAFKIVVNEDDWYIEMGPEFMKYPHAVGKALGDPEKGKEYIYINSFVEGYHGGAIDGEDHPNPGEPWWKIHGLDGRFTDWYMPAPQGPSPYKYISEESQKYLDEADQQMVDEYEKLIKPYVDNFLDAIQNAINNRRW